MAYMKGDQFLTPAGGVVKRISGMWQLRAHETEPENLERQVFELLEQLTSDLGVWNELSRQFRVDLFCGWFMGRGNEGVEIAPRTMAALSSRQITLSLDIYGPGTAKGGGHSVVARRSRT